MPFTANSLHRSRSIPTGLGAGNVNTIGFFDYASADAQATIAAAGYFNGAREQLTTGSVITAVGTVNATPTVEFYVVTAVPASGNVTVGVEAGTA
jgi:hypothetical protein